MPKKQPHFFKAKSSLGGINNLIRQTHRLNGVEDGPDRILTSDFLLQFPNTSVSEFEFSKLDEINPADYYRILSTELSEFSHFINQYLQLSQTQVVLGGDNSVTLSTLQAVMDRIGDASSIGYIQFDSHGEMHLYQSSVSKNFHGMYMRPFLSKFDIPEIDQLVPQKLNFDQVFTIGDIIYDEGEDAKLGERELYRHIRNVSRAEFLKNQSTILAEFAAFIKHFRHLHINFDIDIFDSSIAGATGEDEGLWFWPEIYPFLDLIRQAPRISLDLVEYNPHLPGAERSLRLIHQILNLLLQD